MVDNVARLGEAWRFRQTFERARALMKAQDNWCLKAQAAASTGKLSIMQEEDFPSELELDVIVGTIEIPPLLTCQGYSEETLEVTRPLQSLSLIISQRALLRGPSANLIPTEILDYGSRSHAPPRRGIQFHRNCLPSRTYPLLAFYFRRPRFFLTPLRPSTHGACPKCSIAGRRV